MTTPADTFTLNVPTIEQGDAVATAIAGQIVQSFNARPILNNNGTIEALLVKWKFGNGETDKLLIAPYAALMLRMIISQLEENDWTELPTIPPDLTAPQQPPH
jgi:hypothetical protein